MTSGSERPDDPKHTVDPVARLRAGREPGDDLVPAIALVVVAVVVPLLVAARYEGHIRLYMDTGEYNVLVGLGLTLGLWLIVDGLDLDRVTVFGTAIMAPVPATIGVALVTAVLEVEWLDSFVFFDVPSYSVAIIAAGALAVGLSLLTEQLSIRHTRLPVRRKVTAAAGTTALFGIGVGAGVQYATPPPASIDGIDLDYSGWEATFRVDRETASEDLHITVVAPDGTAVTERLADAERNWTRVSVPHPERSLHRGRFAVSIDTFWGNTVDSTSITVENGPELSIRRVETGTTSRNDVLVTATVGNHGDVAGRTEIDLHGAANDHLDETTATIDPGATTTDTLTVQRDADETQPDSVLVTAKLEGAETDADR
ncbi:hypothetical protein [Natrinema salinisoli]|uniref:hypothetical protein n=1 Tax=Natrinema salinisoli TaxID=2878535 RepID=UPI001CF032E8|nr:hypothetical protein [Natrinema salinisoli]